MHRQKIAFLASLCLFLSAVEYAIPKPLPFMRLGLANLPIILALNIFSFPELLLLTLLKVLCQAIISGTLISYIVVFSIAGTFSSLLTMWLLNFLFKKKQYISLLGISLAGALANNGAQLFCSQIFMFGQRTKYVAPLLLITGTVTGLLLGAVALLVEKKSEWYKEFSLMDSDKIIALEKNFPEERSSKGSIIKLGFYILLLTAFLLVNQWVQNLYLLYGCTGLSLLLLLIKKRGKYNLLPSVVILLSVTIMALFVPFGKVLFTLGSFRITSGALIKGLHRSGILLGMTFISSLAIDRNLRLPGKTGDLVSEIFLYADKLKGTDLPKESKNIFSRIDKQLCKVWATE